MSILVALVLGGLVGGIAALAAGRSEGIIFSIVIGVIGSIIGSFLSVLLTGSDRAFLTFSWSGLAWSFAGALIFVLILNALQRRGHSQV